MKKITIYLICFACVFAIAGIYFDVIIELQSIYWLVGKLIVFSALILFLIIQAKTQKQDKLAYNIFMVCIWVLVFGNMVYRDIAKYKRNICQDKFGREFNARRRRLGIPEIPPDWHIKYRNDRSFEWQGKNSVIGHQSKYISIDTCLIDFEEDRYHLKSVHGISRTMSINIGYAKGSGKDSIFCHYDVGSDSHLITLSQADSILAADKIKKD